eukprot:GHVS01010881.1.p1 GENE.GHVS01010881.1~~GHVS01010881.1.p1  ORF type:complete len:1534 (-),score=185.84 GHVS01010881.1:14-4615(-)
MVKRKVLVFQLRKGPDLSDPMHRLRMWESAFFLNSFQNLESREQFFFYSITFGHINPRRNIVGSLRRRRLFTPGFRLTPGQFKPLHVPLAMWPHKVMVLPYAELKHYAISVDLWKINDYYFNQLYACARMTLEEVVNSEPEFQMQLLRRIKGKKRSFEVHKIRVSLQLSEVFDFDMHFDSWWFMPDRKMPEVVQKMPKFLRFILPRGHRRGTTTRTTPPAPNNFWPSPCSCTFRGTMQHLANAYFVVSVSCFNPAQRYRAPAKVGTCIMSLKSVAQYPLFRGIVKKMTTVETKFQQGELMGNIRCYIRSVGVHEYEEVKHRPSQPIAGAALVTQLDLHEQYLVIRLFKCENIPAANTDSGSSDPLVKIKWDGIVNTSFVRPGTCRPVFNQNFYFPIRLLDPRERRVPSFIKDTLPLDLYSKGPIVFEVWDQDETSSDFLGGCEVLLSTILKEGLRESRCLAEGLGESHEKSRLPDGRPAGFRYKGDDQVDEEEEANPDEEVEQREIPIFEKPIETCVYKGDGQELRGSTVPLIGQGKSTIYYEIFFIPDFPEGLSIPEPPSVKIEKDLWKQFSKRWNRDFDKWMKMYLEWFPEAPARRRFLCTAGHPQTNNLFPLPCFVVPISVPAQISQEGELLHWICSMNFLYPPKQLRTGELPRWLSPNYFLITRKGSINDHALLLCSCLLGLDYDAYVCKGTINNGNTEHVWVATRHENGWVTFWEITTKKRYDLCQRWGYPKETPPENESAVATVNREADQNPYWDGAYLQAWQMWAAQQQGITPSEPKEPLAGLDQPELDVSWDSFGEEGEVTEEDESRNVQTVIMDKAKLRKVLQEKLSELPISPRRELLEPDLTLAFVPYSSIEVMFNNSQLWGNLQNHHPACITYDLENEWKWRPFLFEQPAPIDANILIAPPTRDRACEQLADDIGTEVAENIRLVRNKRGLNSHFEFKEEMFQRLEKYLDLLEYRLHLDPLFDPGPPEGHEAWSAWGMWDNVETQQENNDQTYQNLRSQGSQFWQAKEHGGEAWTQYRDNEEEKPEEDFVMPEGGGTQLQSIASPEALAAAQPPQDPAQQSNPLQFCQEAQHGVAPNDSEWENIVRRVNWQQMRARCIRLRKERSKKKATRKELDWQQHRGRPEVARGSKRNESDLDLSCCVLDGEVVRSQIRVIEPMSSSAEKTGKADEPFVYVHGSCSVGGRGFEGTRGNTPSFHNIFECVRPLDVNRLSYEEEKRMEATAQELVLQGLESINICHGSDTDSNTTTSHANEIAPASFAPAPQHSAPPPLDYDDLAAVPPPPQALSTAEAPLPPPPPPVPATVEGTGAGAVAANQLAAAQYAEELIPPPKVSTEYTLYDGGIDVTSMGFSAPKTRKRRIKQIEVIEGEEVVPEEVEEPETEQPKPPNEWKRPTSNMKYQMDQVAKWKWYYRMEGLYYNWQKYKFPVRANHTFTGFSLHFSTTDVAEMRGYLSGARRFRKFIEIDVDNIVYVIFSKVYPLMGGVVSTWLFLGCEIPWTTVQDRETRMRRPPIKRRRHKKRRS